MTKAYMGVEGFGFEFLFAIDTRNIHKRLTLDGGRQTPSAPSAIGPSHCKNFT